MRNTKILSILSGVTGTIALTGAIVSSTASTRTVFLTILCASFVAGVLSYMSAQQGSVKLFIQQRGYIGIPHPFVLVGLLMAVIWSYFALQAFNIIVMPGAMLLGFIFLSLVVSLGFGMYRRLKIEGEL